MKRLIQLLIGALFGSGLVLSGMTDPSNIRAFLSPFSGWNPQLMLVMASALAVVIPTFFLLKRKEKPLISGSFMSSHPSAIDKPLIIGASLFGLGWGLYGYCPGPAITALVYGQLDTLIFIIAMFFGMFAAKLLTALKY
jgi:hypothetical protein